MHLKDNIKSSTVLFLITLPLCLGIALASNTPIIAGVIAGIVGGIVVGVLSGSHTSVSGPAAGLTIVVLNGLNNVPTYQAFLLAVMLAGIFQLILSKLKAGGLGDFIPGAVISGMLAAIGLLLVLKQIPHALGYDMVFEGDEEFYQVNGKNTFTEIFAALQDINAGAIFIAFISIILLIVWDKIYFRGFAILKFLPSQLVVVILGVSMNYLFSLYMPEYHLSGYHLSDIPLINHDIVENWNFPDFTQIVNVEVWKLAAIIAIVASIESLVSIQAADKIDPQYRVTPPNRELMAQGFGNLVSGFMGGLPITSVVVRTSANINAGAKSKWSSIFHGILLLLSVLFLAPYINMIPKSTLAALLIHVGFKLSKPAIFREEFRRKYNRFIPFLATIVAILLTDLLIGIAIGVAVSMCFILVSNYHTSLILYNDHNNYLLRFNKEVSFLNKKNLKNLLNEIPDHSNLLIDSTKSDFVDVDIIETIDDFILSARNRDIKISVKTTATKPNSLFNIQ